MPYIGNPPAERFTSFAYQDLTGGSGTSFTLDNAVGNPQEIEVFVNNVRQEPGVAYTVSGTALTMTGSIATTDDFYVVFQGKAIQTATHPSDRALTATDGTFTGNTSVTGNATVTGNLTVDTNTLFVDSTNNHVAVGTTTPSTYTAFVSGSTSPGLVVAGTQAALVLVDTDISGNDGTLGITKGGEDTLINNLGNGSIKFFNNGSERAAFLADGGLTFNGDSGQANALDDYEEGSWTPVYDTTGTGFGSIGYHEQKGRYVRVGRQVHAWWLIATNSLTKSSASSSVIVTGLPYTVENVDYQSGVIAYSQTWVTNHPISNLAAYNGTHIFLYYSNGSTSHANITPSNMVDHSGSNKHYVYGAVSYRAA